MEKPGRPFDLYQLIRDENILISYIGEVSFDIINVLIKMVRQALGENEKFPTKKIYGITVECLENVNRHGVNQNVLTDCVFVLSRKDKSFFVTTGNYVKSEYIEGIKESLEEINSMDLEGKKKFYKENLIKGKISEKGGAGIGLIDVAIKSELPLNYRFVEVDNSKAFFVLNIQVQY